MSDMPNCDSAALDPKRAFYRTAIEALQRSGIPFLVGGAYALKHYTNILRDTKDLDIFLCRRHIEPALAVLAAVGYRTELTFEHWIGKALWQDYVIDVIFNSGNGLNPVAEDWFGYAPRGQVLGVPVRLSPAEEMIWSKAFIMERERYDGADIQHVFLRWGARLDWQRLLRRFAGHSAVLLSHVALFHYIYPGERASIPPWVLPELSRRLADEWAAPPTEPRLCRGPMLSHSQYRMDLQCWGYRDARLRELGGPMSAEEIRVWTRAFEKV